MKKNVIVTIGRSIGAGGLEVAKKLSDRISVEMFDRELILLAAKESGIDLSFLENNDEKPASKGKFFRFFGAKNSPYGNDMNGGYSNNILSDDRLFGIQSDVMLEIASKKSCIFVGRCADYILRDCPNLFSVFIQADLEDRIARISQNRGITPEEAEKFIEKAERRRREYYNYYTFKQWGDSASYDLCLSTTCFGVDGCVDMIIDGLTKKGLI
ncbi:MAG: cytidylate kinase-like family protein [Bacteroidales bacterium]|nr:cytidylate kinase-like family protein [Bacteroidales bacterium]